MSEREGPGSKRPRWGRLSRTLSFWLLVLLVPAFLLQVVGPRQEQATELTYTQFSAQIERDNIAEVTFIEGRRVEGTLRSTTQVDGEPVNKFLARLPIENDESCPRRLILIWTITSSAETGYCPP
jgi:hypothetical protein